ncbi:MAG: hypothetical protein ABJD11_12555 [Gemmatimonadota bacterium]
MKRTALLFGALALAAANTANAQLTMQMSNGWSFSFSGNVNIFAQYQSVSTGNATGALTGGLVSGTKNQGFYYGTGLLPAFATFGATGKEGNTDLGVHFGFAPEVQCGGNNHDCFGAEFSGASIDMRQVYLTVGGSWGQILAGRELGVYQRQNILNDQTLFGVGGGGIAPRGTTLGRIGFGYIYPNFEPQITYSTPGGRPGQLSIGLFDPSNFGVYTTHNLPRLEAEGTWKSGHLLLFASGTLQNSKTAPTGGTSKTATGGAAGITYKTGTFSLHGSGYAGKGLGTTLLFGGLADDGAGTLRTSYGYFGQIAFTPMNSKATIAGSFGSSFLKSASTEAAFKTENSLASAGLYYQATKSLKLVWEGDYMWTKDHSGTGKNKAFTGAFGMMLFY